MRLYRRGTNFIKFKIYLKSFIYNIINILFFSNLRNLKSIFYRVKAI